MEVFSTLTSHAALSLKGREQCGLVSALSTSYNLTLVSFLPTLAT